MTMKKLFAGASLALVLFVSAGVADAANIGNLSGQACAGTGVWHFVNNQTGGAAAGTLSAAWSSGNLCVTSPSKVLGSTQHFYCTASGTLLSAVTNLPGKLVLSDFSCLVTPPPCDPTKEICDCDPKKEVCEQPK